MFYILIFFLALVIATTLLAMTNKEPSYPDSAFYTYGKESKADWHNPVAVLQPSNIMFDTSKEKANGVEL